MQPVFKNILFPVNLRENTEIKLEEAIAFANRLGCNLHILLTIQRRNIFDFFWRKQGNRILEKKKELLASIRREYSRQMNPGCTLVIRQSRGAPLKEWMDYMGSNRIDLLYLDESAVKERHLFLNAHQLAAASTCSLLTSCSQSGLTKPEKIILPIGDSLPLNRIRITAFLAYQLNAAIHLVSNERSGLSEINMAYLKKTHRLLVENTGLQVVCSTLPGDDLKNSALRYARSVNAGLIVAKADQHSHSIFHKLFPSSPGDIPTLLLDS